MPQIFEDLGVTSAGDEEDDSSVILSPRGTATGVEDRRKEAGVDACNGEAGEDRRGEGQGLRCEGWRLAQGPPKRRGEGRRRPAATIPDTDPVQLLLLLQDKQWVHLSHPRVKERLR